MPTTEHLERAMQLLDRAIEDGTVIASPEGLVLADESATHAELDRARERQKLGSLDPEDDSTPQEQVILGFVLNGETDNTTVWAKFRSAIGLVPGHMVPEYIWSDPGHLRIAAEIDAAFHGKRDVRSINGRALVESFRLRAEREQVTGSLQGFAETVRALCDIAGKFVQNDFDIAVDLLKSKRARATIRASLKQLDYSLKLDRPVETVVTDLAESLEKARALVAGRLGSDMQLDTFESMHSLLLAGMEAEKAEPIPTGIRALDIDLQGGVNVRDTGKLNVIAARTGVGKTTVGIAAGMGLALRGAHVLFLSCELNSQEISARAMAHYASVNGFQDCKSWILEGRGSGRSAPDGFNELRDLWVRQRQSGEIGDWSSKALFHATAEDMVEVVMAAKAKDPKLSVVFLDHFHALKPSKGYQNRSQEMEARTLYLHQSAKAAHVDLFLLAQLNREACLTSHPQLEHINGTDVIGQLSTAVWLLEFPKREEGTPFDPSSLVCWHAKFRNGQRDAAGNRINEEMSELSVDRDFCRVVG